MPSGADITLAVNPQDLKIIEAYIRETGGAAGHLLTLLKSDPDLQPGSLRLESDTGRIDAGFIDALDRLGNLLQEQALYPQINQSGTGEGQNDG
jgi:flagellar biosynthesis/type III secretory pathway protein FliH